MEPICYISFQGNMYSTHCLKQHQIYGQSLLKLPWINIHFKRINIHLFRSQLLINILVGLLWSSRNSYSSSAVQQVTCCSPFQNPHLDNSREAWICTHTNLHVVIKDCLFTKWLWLGSCYISWTPSHNKNMRRPKEHILASEKIC